ncbi:sigma-54-dependent Fis family transcriptional regulator [candidate division KSB1 bacterium]|nr:sigma-54-dependent Fis family transcriptional regulator [candidate division KSB1 bacterium]
MTEQKAGASGSGLLTSEQILAVGQKLMELRPLAEVLDAVLDMAAETMHAETALILLKDSGKLSVAAQRHTGAGVARGLADISTSLLDEALTKHEPVFTESAIQDPRFSGKSSIILQGIQAAVIVPLSETLYVRGAIYLDSRSDRTLFSPQNIGPLSTLAALSTIAMENARRYDIARRELQLLKGEKAKARGGLVGSSPSMMELYSLIERVAASDLPVLITGESGTGKELVAREIHQSSERRGKPFLALYCGNVAPQLFESELFGHKRGSFTGATQDKQGLVEAARGGTLFLDEVADIPGDLQTKLLRFLQEGEYRAVGDTKTYRADVRIVTATNKDLKREAIDGRFRSDLFYRLYILPVHAPPLRERLSDMQYLTRHFIEKYDKAERSRSISPEALRKLMTYSWPGNVRELENTVARALVVSRGDRLEAEDILLEDAERAADDLSWKSAEQKHIMHVLSVCAGNKSRAAELLGISRRYLHYKLKEWGEGE